MVTTEDIVAGIHAHNSEKIAQALADGLEDRMSIAMNESELTTEDEKIMTLYNAATEVLYSMDTIEPEEMDELILEETDGHSD